MGSFGVFYRNYPFWPFLKAHKKVYLLGTLALIVVDLVNVAIPVAVKYAIDAVPLKNTRGLVTVGVVLLGMMVLQSACRFLWRIFFQGASYRITSDLRLKLYSHLQKLPLQYYQKVRTGDLMSRMTNDIEAIRMALGPGVLVSLDAVILLALLIPLMLWMSVKLTLLALAFLPLVPWLTSHLGKKIERVFAKTQGDLSELSAYTQESLRAIRLIKSLVLEDKVKDRFSKMSSSYVTSAITVAKYEAILSPSLSLLSRAGVFLILIVGGMDVIQGALTVGTFVAFHRFVGQVSWPMEAMGWAVTLHQEGAAAYARLQEVLLIDPVKSSHPNLYPTPKQPTLLRVDNLSYQYPTPEGFVLSLSDLSIGQGKRVGIVGPVGAGKTTLFQLILRLYEPPQGTIFWKNEDVTTVPLQRLRQEIASVEQQIFLFSENISDNITMGITEPLSRHRILTAGTHAGIEKEILSMESGLDSLLGERGVDLSGGQKQRIAIARALVRSPELVLLDDCFSAVDVEVERQIIDNLINHYPTLSLCVASHRLSIMPLMDEIWLLEHGHLVEKAPHDQLLVSQPLYRQLWETSQVQRDKPIEHEGGITL